jgi:hypothetical protein
MRFIWMHKSDKYTDADVPPSPELIARMGNLMEEMTKAGVLLAGEGLQPSSRSVRLKFSRGQRTVTPGPLAGSNELVAGFAIVRMKSMEEAIEWAARLGKVVGDAVIDIGQLKEPWDLGLCPRPQGQATRFMIMLKADEKSEAGIPPTPEVMRFMNELSGEAATTDAALVSQWLQPSSKGARLKFSGGKSRVIDGPFTESKELIGGYCILQVKSREDAFEWAVRFAQVLGSSRLGSNVEVDILPLYEM